MLYRIVVEPTIRKEQVAPTIERAIAAIAAKDPEIDELSLLVYSDKELVHGAYDVAMALGAPGGELGNVPPEIATSNDRTGYKTTIEIKENLEEYLRQRGKSEKTLGLTEETRRRIFKGIVAAEDRAHAEAEKRYPTNIMAAGYKPANPEKNIDLSRKLQAKYKAAMRAKYGISEEAQNKIAAEGLTENWPLE